MIDEKKLIEDIKRKYCDSDFMDDGIIQLFVDFVNNQPKIGEWIPCSEELPTKPKENPVFGYRPVELYLVDCGGEYPFRAFWNGRYFTDGFSRVDAIAWRPLPEPFEEV